MHAPKWFPKVLSYKQDPLRFSGWMVEGGCCSVDLSLRAIPSIFQTARSPKSVRISQSALILSPQFRHPPNNNKCYHGHCLLPGVSTAPPASHISHITPCVTLPSATWRPELDFPCHHAAPTAEHITTTNHRTKANISICRKLGE